MGVEVPFAVERDTTGDCIVSDDLSLAYGTGRTEQDACTDYLISLAEMYGFLLKHGDSPLWRHTCQQFSRLAEVLLAARGASE